MKFGGQDVSRREPDPGNSFAFSPTATAVELAQSGDFANAVALSDGFDLAEFAKNLEKYWDMIPIPSAARL